MTPSSAADVAPAQLRAEPKSSRSPSTNPNADRAVLERLAAAGVVLRPRNSVRSRSYPQFHFSADLGAMLEAERA